MKKLFVLLLASVINVSVYSQTGDDYYQMGRDAYDKENYQKAEQLFKKAAETGHNDACGFLSAIYYYGLIDGKKKTDIASLWAKRAEKKSSVADVILSLIAYYDGDYGKTIQILDYWKDYTSTFPDDVKLALAISYMMNGSESNRILGRQKAEPLIKEVYKQWRNEDEKPLYFYSASAILAKIEFEKKGEWTNSVQKYIDVFGEIGSDDYMYCPLTAYVMGRYYRKVVEYKDFGEKCIEVAAKYDYKDNDYEILFPFADEIKKEYNKTK